MFSLIKNLSVSRIIYGHNPDLPTVYIDLLYVGHISKISVLKIKLFIFLLTLAYLSRSPYTFFVCVLYPDRLGCKNSSGRLLILVQPLKWLLIAYYYGFQCRRMAIFHAEQFSPKMTKTIIFYFFTFCGGRVITSKGLKY